MTTKTLLCDQESRRAARQDCNKCTFHADIPDTAMVNAVGKERGAVFHEGPAAPLLTDPDCRKKILWP